MAIVVFRENEAETITSLMEFIKDSFPALSSLMYVINPKKNDDISDQEIILSFGRPFLMEELPAFRPADAPLKFRIGPVSFFQVNVRQAARMYGVATEMAGLRGNETVYDLYCGTGTIACYIAKYAGKVVGMEYIPSAVSDAYENAVLNGIGNVSFHAGDIAKELNAEFFSRNGKPDVIITDPPRSGMHEKVVRQIIEAAPEKVIYISCNPATQARDIQLMSEKYEVTEVQPVDMFPHTQHVENVVALKKTSDHHPISSP
jgi:23S rRNA (uracil1939-C5)-methyltransferase